MSDSLDPSVHRDREKQFISHVRTLLNESRLMLDTKRGRLPVDALFPVITEGEPGVERGEKLKRQMLELGVADRSLQSKMPVGERIGVTLRQKRFWGGKKTVGEFVVVCASPTKALVKGQPPAPMDAAEVNGLLSRMNPSGGVPVTIVLMSTAGFTAEARALASDTTKRILVTMEPNEAGGWTATGPGQAAQLVDVLDPEEDQAKRRRVRDLVEANKYEMMNGGIASDKIAAKAQLPSQFVEAELKNYAKETPGLAARQIEGRLTLFREGSMFSNDPGGSTMPFWEKVKGVFNREESPDKKIARFNADLAGLTVQRDRAYDEIASVEKKEADLTKGFKEATALTQRRIATEIGQIRKDIERRQQVLTTIDKQINIVKTSIHTLEMQKQVSPGKLKAYGTISTSVEDVEAGLAELQQLDEEADSLAGIGSTSVSDDVQSIMDELKGKTETPPEPEPAKGQTTRERAPEQSGGPVAPERHRGGPEAG